MYRSLIYIKMPCWRYISYSLWNRWWNWSRMVCSLPRFATNSVVIVVYGSATAGFATAGGCGPSEILEFIPAMSGSISFGTTVGGWCAEVEVWFIVRMAMRAAIEEAYARWKLVRGISWSCSAWERSNVNSRAYSLLFSSNNCCARCTLAFPILSAVLRYLLPTSFSRVSFPIAWAPYWSFSGHRVLPAVPLWVFLNYFLLSCIIAIFCLCSKSHASLLRFRRSFLRFVPPHSDFLQSPIGFE